jgi:Asp-tRNA(Asn)/Glu-tRNA(Gln) amidotransferase C subunit
MNIRLSYVSLALWLVCAASQAQAGVVIQQVERAIGNNQSRQTVTISMDAGKLRVEGENPGQGKYLLIFDNAKQVMWMADLAKGSYMEITKAQVEQMAGQMGQMMQQMQQAMAQVPPEQRAMMEQMMRGRMGGMAAPPQITVRDKGASDTVGQFSCKRYEILTNGQVSSELCAADPSQLKLDASAFETFKALAEFYEPLRRAIPQVGGGGWSTPNAMDQINGFPVQTISYEGGRPASEWVLQTVEERAIDAAHFALPSNLKKQEMPRMPQGR